MFTIITTMIITAFFIIITLLISYCYLYFKLTKFIEDELFKLRDDISYVIERLIITLQERSDHNEKLEKEINDHHHFTVDNLRLSNDIFQLLNEKKLSSRKKKIIKTEENNKCQQKDTEE